MYETGETGIWKKSSGDDFWLVFLYFEFEIDVIDFNNSIQSVGSSFDFFFLKLFSVLIRIEMPQLKKNPKKMEFSYKKCYKKEKNWEKHFGTLKT